MKKLLVLLLLSSFSLSLLSQSKEAGTDREEIKKYMTSRDKEQMLSVSKDDEDVQAVLKQYSLAIEKLDLTGTEILFTSDSQIFESGGNEGTYTRYLEQHLIPELKEFSSFKYSDYKVDVRVDGKYAFATETYIYSIVLAKDNSEVKRMGVTTSVLKKLKGDWKIMISHNSSRR